MDKPLVTIGIPAYNAEKTIGKTLRSLLNQTYSNIQIHVADNCSTDKTLQVVTDLIKIDDRIFLHTLEERIESHSNLERALLMCAGQYHAVYHADDVYEPEMIETAVSILEKDDHVGGVTTRAIFIDENDVMIGQSKTFRQLGLPASVNYITFKMIPLLRFVMHYSNFLICPTLMFRKELLPIIGEWPRGENYGTSGDLEVWLRIAQNAGLAFVSRPLIRYRKSTKQGSYIVHSQRTRPADFFNVVDHYVNDPKVSILLTSKDLQHYQSLKDYDSLKCIARAMVQNEKDLAKKILSRLSFREMFFRVFATNLGFKYFIFYLVLKIFIIMPNIFSDKINTFLTNLLKYR